MHQEESSMMGSALHQEASSNLHSAWLKINTCQVERSEDFEISCDLLPLAVKLHEVTVPLVWQPGRLLQGYRPSSSRRAVYHH